MHSSPYHQFFKTAVAAVDQAEEIILKYFHEQTFVVEKKADNTPVTIADKTAEKVIKDQLHKAFPDHGFFGEEEGEAAKDAEFVWSIDPIDGTKNFVRGLPFFSTELALLHQGKVVVGISNEPIFRQRLHAIHKQGAFANGQPINVSSIPLLKDAYVSHGGVKYFAKHHLMDQLITIARTAYSCRGFGDSWGFQQVAQGKIDVVVEAHVRLWDIAAHAIIIEEAGGKVTDLDGAPVGFDSTKVLATNGAVHQELLALLRSVKL